MSPLGIKPILDDDTETVVPPSTDEVSPKMKPTFVPMADIRPEVKPSVVQMAEGRPKIVKKADIRPNSGKSLSNN